jgi:hypothetical protein
MVATRTLEISSHEEFRVVIRFSGRESYMPHLKSPPLDRGVGLLFVESDIRHKMTQGFRKFSNGHL